MPLLVALLTSAHSAVQETAAVANCPVGSQWYKDAVVAAVAVPLLVPLVSSDQPSVQECAAGALRILELALIEEECDHCSRRYA